MLDPVVHIGKEGVTVAARQAVREAFNTRELVKVRVLEAAPQDARATGEALAEALHNVALVQAVGRVVILYRPDPEQPEIQLPR